MSGAPNRLGIPPELKGHVDFVAKTSRKLARELFHAMMFYQAGLEKKQRVLFRFVNVGSDVFGIVASCSRATMLYNKNPNDKGPIELAHLLTREAERRVKRQFHGLFKNDDKMGYQVALNILGGKYEWLEDGIIKFE